MKRILIATRNKDKFRIISKLLKTNSFKEFEFLCLDDINDKIIDKKETGDILNRSYEKALNTYNNIHNNEFEYIIGIDDGIKIKGKIIENVKEYIKPIINDEYLKENEEIAIVRAYSFINSKGKRKSIITEIPFRYIKLKKDFIIEENSYPLSHVMAPVNSTTTVSELDENETNLYYLNYSNKAFEDVKLYYDN